MLMTAIFLLTMVMVLPITSFLPALAFSQSKSEPNTTCVDFSHDYIETFLLFTFEHSDRSQYPYDQCTGDCGLCFVYDAGKS